LVIADQRSYGEKLSYGAPIPLSIFDKKKKISTERGKKITLKTTE